MRMSPHLAFLGNCEEAFRFYHHALGGDLVAMVRYGETPAGQGEPALHDKIAHARLVVGDAVLMGSDCGADRYAAPGGTMTMIGLDTPEEAERVFAALSEGGAVSMPMMETFFARRFGVCNDRFGVPWMVICEKPMDEACSAA
ncbi:MAG: hypothetical protein BGO51_17830 [Rhodospirillales bacterium 69-11]|nr:VOC family protein [Rhodospirillales bacterium]MBN8926704.1 VOC family protein [Rhodospirillales bacterium]OJW20604.1 MAG: hypothetical protein BGO51_17830 [Rhodospirillales bacterium 69-11]